MWLIERMQGRKTPFMLAEAGQVSSAGAGGLSVVGACEYRRVPVFAPGGYEYLPTETEQLALFSIEGEPICLGCASMGVNLEPGEVRISSKGGATILLKNTGEIHLNGLVITPGGEILLQGGS